MLTGMAVAFLWVFAGGVFAVCIGLTITAAIIELAMRSDSKRK